MSASFEELDFRPTPMGVLSLRRRRRPSSDIDVYEIKLGDEFLMSSLFTVAEIALALGKRYTQDVGLDWGVAADRKAEDLTRHAPEGSTKKAAKEKTNAADRRDDPDDDERDG